MKQVLVTVKDKNLLAMLIREADPRLAICQDRICLLNRHNKVIAERDLLTMFTTTEKVEASLPVVTEPVKKQTATTRHFKLNGDIAQDFNDTQEFDKLLEDHDYWERDMLHQEW